MLQEVSAMPLPFRRLPQNAQDPWAAPICSRPSPEQRKWEVDALLSSLSPDVRAALSAWLLAPTDLNRWPPPARFSARRLPFSPALGRQSAATSCELLYEELRAMRQTLDFPPEAMSGLTRNGLLTVHAIRLRQLEGWLWPFFAARAIKQMIAG